MHKFNLGILFQLLGGARTLAELWATYLQMSQNGRSGILNQIFNLGTFYFLFYLFKIFFLLFNLNFSVLFKNIQNVQINDSDHAEC